MLIILVCPKKKKEVKSSISFLIPIIVNSSFEEKPFYHEYSFTKSQSYTLPGVKIPGIKYDFGLVGTGLCALEMPTLSMEFRTVHCLAKLRQSSDLWKRQEFSYLGLLTKVPMFLWYILPLISFSLEELVKYISLQV